MEIKFLTAIQQFVNKYGWDFNSIKITTDVSHSFTIIVELLNGQRYTLEGCQGNLRISEVASYSSYKDEEVYND